MKTRNMARLIGLGAVLAGGGSALAQDRMVEAISVVPSAGAQGFYDISAVWSCGVVDSAEPIDISGILEMHINGQLIERRIFAGGTFGGSGFCGDGGNGCGGSCGTGYVDGVFAGALLCIYDGPISPGFPDCDCRFPPLLAEFPGVPLVPGDDVSFHFSALSGADPDPFPANDIERIEFNGVGQFWGRTLNEVRILPGGEGETGRRIEVDSFSWGTMDGTFNMGGELMLLVNGMQVASIPSATDWITAGACVGGGCQSNPCATDMHGLPLAYCTPNGPETCVPDCGWDSFNASGPEFVGIELDPGDVIEVILMPSPGALPELPGFPSDDEGGAIFCPGDTTGDGKVDVSDLNEVLSNWGLDVEAGSPGDLTGNGKVNVDDLNEVLAHWGDNCAPV